MFGNLLKTALNLIPKQTVAYYAFKARTTNDWGKDVTEYELPLQIAGSFQAVAADRIQMLGLDLAREYVMFYCSHKIMEIERDTSGDQLVYKGVRYQVLNKNDWVRQDGWNGVMCVRVYD